MRQTNHTFLRACVLAMGAAVVLSGCATVSLDTPDWPPMQGAGQPAPVVTRNPVASAGTAPLQAQASVLPEDAGVIVTPVASSALEAAPFAPPSSNLDSWAGTYRGMLPCADCEGILALLTLRKDSTYVLSLSYQGRPDAKPLIMRGNFTWNADETQIELDDNGHHRRYRIGNGEARMLNRDGSVITGVLGDSYVLKKREN